MLSPLNAILNMAQSNPNIARNLCNTMGITPEEATKQAANFFNIPH